MDDLKIELGYALLPLVNATGNGDRLTEQIKALRRSLPPKWASSCRRCVSSTTCSSTQTATSSRSRKWTPAGRCPRSGLPGDDRRRCHRLSRPFKLR
jgi:hypothetical protein